MFDYAIRWCMISSRTSTCDTEPRDGTAMSNDTVRLRERIVQDANILVGKPVVRGTRIPVELVLGRLAANPDLNELLQDYPRLTVDDVRACLEYASDLVARQERIMETTHGAI